MGDELRGENLVHLNVRFSTETELKKIQDTASETSKICAIDESGTLYVGDSLMMQTGKSYAMYDEYNESGSATTGNVTFKVR